MSIGQKRSQVTIFLIVGLVMILAVFLIIAGDRSNVITNTEREIAKISETAFASDPVKIFVEQCLEFVSKDGLRKLGQQSGFLFSSQGGVTQDYDESSEGEIFALYKGIKVTFFGNNIPPLKEESEENSIEKQLEVFIESNIGSCLDFSIFENQGLKISKGEKAINAEINENNVVFSLDYPLIVENPDGGKTEINNFFSAHEVRLKKIYEFVKQYVEVPIVADGISIDVDKDDSGEYTIIIVSDEKSMLDGTSYKYFFATQTAGGDISSITGAVVSEGNNIPTADVGLNRTVALLESTLLFGSGADADNDEITFKWQLIDKPGGSLTTLSSLNIANPSFVPDLDGAYISSLRTNDGKSFSEPSYLTITAKAADPENSKPVSVPGQEKNVDVGREATLPGFGNDNDGDNLIYMWMLSRKPSSSKAVLEKPNVQSLIFKPDVAGNYTLKLIVNDGQEDSVPAEVKIIASPPGTNRAPTADAGYNKKVKTGIETMLLGNGFDPDNDDLTFSWAIRSKPPGSTATLSNNNIPNPTFTPGVNGTYEFSLIVDDGQLDSTSSTAVYTAQAVTGNSKPTANAGTDINVNVNEEIELHGIGLDDDFEPVSYRWSIESWSVGSGASLSNPNANNPRFIADVEGLHKFILIVNDGKEDSSADEVIINAAIHGESCTHGTCNGDAKQWCNNGVFVSEGYCGNCGNQDSSCPICEANVCDRDNRRWCTNSTWSTISYCQNCGPIDASCGVACTNNVCDTKNKKVCSNGVWEDADYCFKCGSVDGSCFSECINNACDTKNKKLCNSGIWDQNDYCVHCGSRDVFCGSTCSNNICDVTSNKWCNNGAWESLNYCDHCQDSECLGTCTNNACDINAKRWCNNGVWASAEYCNKCGSRDSSCALTCEENICDTTSNKRCYNGKWTSLNYCDNCALKDSDCTIQCAEGQCDAANKKVCTNKQWTNSSYCGFCASLDSTCPSSCSARKDSVCNQNCSTGTDPDCLDINISNIRPMINVTCINNSECAGGICYNGKCAEPSCSDNVKNGLESDMDCGGNCGKCVNGKLCNIDSDCTSNICSSGICAEADTCSDGILSDDETDIDCGGTCSNKCGIAENCVSNQDCGTGLECISNLCSKAQQAEDASDKDIDTDNDGIPDEWEIRYGLNPNDASDANLDLDDDGLINIQEYTFGTNPNNIDSDGDSVSDKEEIEKGTLPTDPVSKPGGIGNLLIWTIVMIILFGAGSYGIYYYKDYLMTLIGRKPQGPTYPARIPTQYIPQTTVIKKPREKVDIKKIVKERRAEKERKRSKVLEAFGEKPKPDIPSSKEKEKPDVFSKLKFMPKNKKE